MAFVLARLSSGGVVGLMSALLLATVPGQGTLNLVAQTPKPGENTYISQLASALLGGATPGLFWGSVSAKDVNAACAMLALGQFDIPTTITGYGATFTLPLKVVATGGCGTPVSPAGVQSVFSDPSGRKSAVICDSDPEFTTKNGCGVFLTGPDIDSLYKQGTSGGPAGRHLLAGGMAGALLAVELAGGGASPGDAAWETEAALADVVYKRAADVAVHDVVWTAGGNHTMVAREVTDVEVVMGLGLFNPFTTGGFLVVDGVLVSAHSAWFLDATFNHLGISPSYLPAIYQVIMAPARALYHLLGKQHAVELDAIIESTKLADDITSSESEEDVSPAVQHKVPFNPFSLLTDSEEEAPAEDDDESEAEQPSTAAAQPPVAPASAPGQSAKAKKKAQQRRKKAADKAKGKGPAAEGSAAQGKKPQQQQVEEEEDLDGLLKQFGVQPAPRDDQDRSAAASTSGRSELLAVDARNLRADEEMRRIFGSKIVEAADRDEGSAVAGGSRRVRRLMARGLIQRRHMKRGILIQPKDHWPPLDGGISMEVAGYTKDGKQLFTYTHSANYQAVQSSFEECQATFDPNNIAALLQHHPYHIDALLAMYELYRAMGEHAYSEEMLERCLYALEMAWHPWFNPAAANCRLNYSVEANRPLFVALFRHMQNLSRRGLHTTALECAKLLLALDPEDPMGALCCIDYFVLRAQQFAYLQRLADEYSGDSSLALLPNFSFSLALARFRLASSFGDSPGRPGRRAKASGSNARGGGEPGQGGETGRETLESANNALIQAVLLHPLVVTSLMERLKEQGIGKDAEWGSILSRPLFAGAGAGGSASLDHLVQIFVERHHLMWKAQDVQLWLKRACDTASDAASAASAADWAAVRAEVFPASPVNEYRHLRVADFSDVISRLPPEEMQAAMAGGGAGGPGMQAGMDPAELAALRAEVQQLAQRMEQGGAIAEEELQGAHPLAMLLRSMLPWVNAGEAPDYEADGEHAADAGNGEGSQP
ncbi:hypothetical protein WJX72_006318 [[Myrmecia] bisecta]|uniref:Transcription factor 25 n=1 Tax=[Myrmecia] bisecta TaxID=41462 RepID=A0AAW1R7B2_9CHLO